MRTLNVGCVCLVVAVTAAAQNLVTNGSFDGGLNGWDYAGVTTYDSTLDATGTAGSGSAKAVVAPQQSRSVVSKCLTVTGATQ
jgi:hypothetical protein